MQPPRRLGEIRSIARATLSAPAECLPFCSGMEAWWRGEGNTKEEVFGISGELVSGAAYAPGLVGQAFSFGGGRDAVLMPSTTLASPFGQLTAELWVYPLSHGSGELPSLGRTLLSKLDSHGFALRVLNGSLQVQLRLTERSANVVFGSSVLPLNEWSHVAMVYDGVDLRVFLNGKFSGGTSVSGLITTTFNRDTPFMIGNEPRVPVGDDPVEPGGYGWHGLIDELAVFSRALAVEEIKALYQARGAGKCPVMGLDVIQQPGDQKVLAGEEAVFNVTVDGDPGYQWFHNGVALPGATNRSLRISPVRKEDGGDYYVRLTRCFASLQSHTAHLVVQRLRTVALVSPVNGGIYPSPTSLAVGAVVSDQDETITKVEFYQGASQIGVDTTAPYGITWSNFTTADYILTARMFDNTGLTATSPPVHITLTESDCLSNEPAKPVDLRKWTVEQFDFVDQGDAVWSISPDNSVATQIFNADASVFLSDFEITDSRVRGTLRVDDPIDDDFIGFVFGYRDPQHFYLFDWKSGSPFDPFFGLAPAGMSVKVIDSASPLGKTDITMGSPDPSRVRIIYHNPIPWQEYTDYQFSLDFLPGHFLLKIKSGPTLLAIISLYDDTYTSGRFGFYNVSQSMVVYRGFSEKPFYTPPSVTLTRPVAESAFVTPTDVILAADASACGVPVTRVEFFQGGLKIGESTEAPYQFTITNVPVGSYSLTARVVDGRGIAGVSVPIAFSVANPNSPPILTGLTDQSMNEDSPSREVDFFVQDFETPATNLIVSVASSDVSLLPLSNTVLSGFETNRALQLTPAKDQFGSATVSVRVTDLGGLSVTNQFTVTVLPVNDPPTLDALPDLALGEDAPNQTVPLTHITSGAPNELQTLTLTATSDNPALIPDPTVLYTTPDATGSLSLQPLADANGSAIIRVVVSDGQLSVTNQFMVTVLPVNDPPTLAALPDLALTEEAPKQTVPLTGITSGATNELQTLTVTATSDNPALIPDPTVTYITPDTIGSLSLQPRADANGSAVIRVVVSDGQLSITNQFTVTVLPVNDPPTIQPIVDQVTTQNTPTAPIRIAIGDIDTLPDTLRLTGKSSNPSVVANDGFAFSGTGTNRSLVISLVEERSGFSVITVTVDDGGATAEVTFKLTVPTAEQPPSVRLVRPEDFSAFKTEEGRTTADILLEAEASDDGKVVRVDFFSGSELIASETERPYQFNWRNVAVGDYQLRAVATDDRGLQTTSAVSRVAVAEEGGDIAIVRTGLESEIDVLRQYLLEMGLGSRVFDMAAATLNALDAHRLVILHLSGAGKPTSELLSTLMLLQQSLGPTNGATEQTLRANGMPLFVIGERVGSAAAELSLARQGEWHRLVHLELTPGLTSGTHVTFVPEAEAFSILKGHFGVVTEFEYSRQIEASRVIEDATSWGMAEESDALITFPDVNATDSGEARTAVQNFQVHVGGGEGSIVSRKALFQNVICWLLRCSDCQNAALSAIALPESVRATLGELFQVPFAVGNNGACEARAVHLRVTVPEGLEWVGAEIARGGSWSYDAARRLATVELGRVGSGDPAKVAVGLTFRSTRAGVVETGLELIANNTVPRRATWQAVIEGGALPAQFALEPVAAGRFRLRVTGAVGQKYEVQQSFGLSSPIAWQMWAEFTGPEWTSPLIEGNAIRQTFYRVRVAN